MPIVVTGARGPLPALLVPAFARRSPEVRAVVDRAELAPPLRELGAKVAVGDLSDPDVGWAALHDAHTVCHLTPGPDLLDDDVTARDIAPTVSHVLEAARRAGIARVLLVSFPGASADDSNPYLRALGEAEAAVREAAPDHVILRCAPIVARGARWLDDAMRLARRWPPVAPAPGTQRSAPVAAADVAEILAAADDRASPLSGTFALQGPDPVSADELAGLLGGRRRRRHPDLRDGPRAARLVGHAVSGEALDLISRETLDDAPDAAAEFGVTLSGLVAALAAAGYPST